MTSSPATRAARSDALRNRRRLFTAAREAFAQFGLDASIAQIAESAGVGKGTVFRHFANKDELIGAVMLHQLDELADLAADLIAATDPSDAVWRFMSAAVEAEVDSRSFCRSAAPVVQDDPRVRASADRLHAVVQRLVDRAQRLGGLRPDVTGRDLVLLIPTVYQAASPYGEPIPELARRYLRLMCDGLGIRNNDEPLPEAPESM